MKRSPAINFYPGDFLSDTFDMDNLERGIYITILCTMFKRGGYLSKQRMERIAGGEVPPIILEYFQKDADNRFYNERLLEEMDKRQKFKNLQKEKANKRWKNNDAAAMPRDTSGNAAALPVGIGIGNGKGKGNKKGNKKGNGTGTRARGEPVYPWDNKDFRKLWANWKDYKRIEFGFKYKSTQSEQAALTGLNNLAGGDQITASEIIFKSMANGWKGFFELKNGKKSRHDTPEEYRAAANDLLEKIKRGDL